MLDVDTSEFDSLVDGLDGGLTRAFPELARDLAEDGESYVFDRIDLVIYDTPERFYNGEVYVRTGKLKGSLNAVAESGTDELSVTLSSGAGAGGRHYGRQNELGRGDSAVSYGRVLSEARADSDPLNMPPYERRNELEPRPFVLPVMAALEDELPERLYKLIDTLVHT